MADFGLPHITEKRYLALAPMLLTANGSADGLITVASTYRIKVGQVLTFKSSSVAIRLAKVKRVISTTQFVVIDPKDPVTTLNKLDMSDLLIADTATVELTQDKRPVIELLEIQRQIYEEEPTVALRTHAVDWLGRSYSRSNPVPVELSDGSISIGTVNAELEVQLSHQDNVPDIGDVHDSVRIGDGIHTLEINSDGSINVTDNGGSLTVDGTINIGNFPDTQNVAIVSSVELEIKNDSGNPVPVNGTVTANQGGTWNINNITGTVSLPTGAATSTLQTTGNTSLSSIDGKTPTLGQKTMTGSSPVVIASDQSVIPINDNGGSLTVDGTVASTQSGTWNINNITGTVSLPTGAATSALQTTGNTSLSSIDTKTPTLGQKTMAGSSPVVIASNQSAIPITDNNGSLTVDGTVAATQSGAWSVSVTSMPEVEIKNDTGNPVPVSGTVTANQGTSPWTVSGTVTANQGTDPWTVNGNVNTTITGTLPGINPDAFGRTRVSEPFTLGDYKHIYAIDPNFIDRVANGGVVSYNQNKACAMLTTSSNSASIAAHQTKFYHHYQPGKSQLVLTSACFGYAQQNVTKRTGYFDDRDGIYFEQVGDATANGTNNGQLNWVIRSYTSGTASEAAVGSYLRRVPQNQWNTDKCDGTGASGFNIDTSKTQLAWLDFQWLGVGRVRCGFVHDGAFIVAHEYHHSNALSEVYISNPNLPVRCEILNTGITAGGSMDQICSTVASEGGYVESGIDFAVTSGKRTTPSQGQTRFPLMAIRLKNSFNGYPNRLSVRPNQLSVYCTDNSIMYEVIKLPSASSMSTTLNDGVLTWTSADASSGVEYCVNATNFVSASADRFASGFVSSGSSQNSLSSVLSGTLTASKKNVISQNIESTDSEIYLVVVSTIEPGNNVTAGVVCGLQWREIY